MSKDNDPGSPPDTKKDPQAPPPSASPPPTAARPVTPPAPAMVKVRFTTAYHHGGHTYRTGDTALIPASLASVLVRQGHATKE